MVFDNNKGAHGAAIRNTGAVFLNSVEIKNHTSGYTLIDSDTSYSGSGFYMDCPPFSGICNSIHDNNLNILFSIYVGINFSEMINVNRIEHIEVYNNTAHVVIHAGGDTNINFGVKIFNSLIVDNTLSYVIRSYNTDSALFDLAHLTIANNSVSYNTLFYSTDSAHYSVYNSILVGDDVSLISLNNNGATAIAYCTVSTGINDISQLAIGYIIADPLFVNSAKGDYRITSQSPAVDVCASSGLGYNSDMDGETRGWDYDSAANNVGMTYDAGADELGDKIFAHGFE